MKVFQSLFFSLLLAVVGLSAANAQSADMEKIYEMGSKYGDANIAIYVIYHQLAENPDDVALKDSLASLYFTSGRWAQSILVAKDVLEKQPKNQKMLELTAISYQNLGGVKEALEKYEELYRLSNSVFHQYQIATLQFQLERFGEAEASLARVIQDKAAETETIVINVNRQGSQETKIKAAALNVLGVLYLQKKEMAAAKKSFEAAAQVDPEFVLPKGNLQAMEEAQKQPETGDSTPNPKTGDR